MGSGTESQGYNPGRKYIGGYTENDGTIEFYTRINSLIDENSVIVDLGAGRGGWYYENPPTYRRSIRLLRNKVKKVIGVDVDEAVLSNPTTDENRLIRDGKLPVEDCSVDVIIADFVLEHISDPTTFAREASRVLKPGGVFCARTPHKLHYVSWASCLIPGHLKSRVIGLLQPKRNVVDAFSTEYSANTISKVRYLFPNYKDFSYIFRSNPAYFGGNRYLFMLMKAAHNLLPKFFIGIMHVFIKKPE